MAILYWTGAAADGDWTNTTNWSTGAIPVAADEVTIDRTSDDINTNIDQNAITLTSLTIAASFQGTIGDIPDSVNEFLQISATTLTMGDGTGNGSQRINIDLGIVVTNINIISASATGADSPKAPLRINADNASNVIQINGINSNVSFLDNADDTGALGTIDVINANNVEIGAGSTYTSLTIIEGTILSSETSGTIKISSGTLRLEGSGTISLIEQTGGEIISNTTGTITTYTARGGTLTTTESAIARTITTITQSPGFTFNRNENVTVTNDNFDTVFAEFTVSIT